MKYYVTFIEPQSGGSVKKFGVAFGRWRGFRLDRNLEDFPVLILLLLCFLSGSLLGCFVGGGIESGTDEIAQMVSGGEVPGFWGFLHRLCTVSQYHVIVLLAATSVIGVFVIPVTSFFRGYFLSCAAAATIASLPEHGIAAAWVSCGINALLTVPSLFLLELDGFGLSKRLRALSAGKSCHFSKGNVSYHLGISAVCLLTASAVDCVLVPKLLAYIL